MLYLLPFVALGLLYLVIKRREVRIGIAIVGAFGLVVLIALAGRDLLYPSTPPPLEPGQVEITDLELTPGVRTTTLTGRAFNLSDDQSIYELEMELTLSDCTDAGCVIIGQERGTTVQRIPPGQLRDVRFTYLFNDLPAVQGTLEWSADVTALRARR
ncbi:hypothetical protein [Pontivivens insulae]|uniref:Uncharacterized protein n=1 Tax=Pontivivens insulae TaxID=1639689 RepID=A0A2R8AA04_9RHOB|nr:hypothetical protein [Pontivivens insulae]SPF29057.1 hypothetical protein POI8812_01362 [Pontivivens insulae]